MIADRIEVLNSLVSGGDDRLELVEQFVGHGCCLLPVLGGLDSVLCPASPGHLLPVPAARQSVPDQNKSVGCPPTLASASLHSDRTADLKV